MQSFLIKSFRGGISDYEDKGIVGAYKFAKNHNPRGSTDALQAQQALTDDLAAGTMTTLAKFIVPASDGNTYFFCDAKIYKRDSGGTYSLVYTDGDGGIIGAAEWYNDNGETGLYWATATKLHRKPLPGLSNWSDVDASAGSPSQTYPKTNLTSADWHTMKSMLGALYIANKNTIAAVFYDESYTNNALQLIPGNIAKCLYERSGYIAIGTATANNEENAGMFFWDGLSTNWADKKFLPTNAINAILETEIPIIQAGDQGKLYYADTVTKMPVLSFPNGGEVNPEGVCMDEGLALFGVFGNGSGYTGVYSYGRKQKNAPFALNLDYQIDVDEIGAIAKINGDIFITYKSGSNYGVKKVDSSNKATTTYESLDLKPPMAKLRRPTWHRVVLQTDPLPSGTSIEVKRRMNKDGSFVAANLQGGATSFSTAGATEAVFLIGDIGKVGEIQIILNPSGNNTPKVYEAQVFFE